MKTETKTIIISSLVIILTIFVALFVMYKIDDKKKENTKPVISTNNIDDNINNSDNQTNNTNDHNDTQVIQDNKVDEDTKNESNENKVIVYLFHGNTCPHCQKAIATLKEKKNTTYKNIQIKTFDVWDRTTDNGALMQKVAEELNVEARYVPFFVIGSSSIDSFNEEKILKQIDSSNKDKNYKDIVTKVINENKDLSIVSDEIK